MRAQLSGVHAQLLRAIRKIVAADPAASSPGPDLPFFVVEDFDSKPWASLTFSGTLHRLVIRLVGTEEDVAAAEARLLEALENSTLELGANFLADFAIEATGRGAEENGHISLTFKLEALTIEE